MNQNQHKRSAFSGKIGFVLSAAGASVGLGNIWRFPYLAAKYGGGIFLLIYIILAFTFGYTMIVAETALGRMTRKSPVGAFAAVRKGGRSFGGWINAIIPILIVPYYSVIGGWVIRYLADYVSGHGSELATDGYFSAFISSGASAEICFVIFTIFTLAIIFAGVRNGVERVSKVMMPILVVLSVIIAGYSVTRPGALEGVKYFLVPNLSHFSGSRLPVILIQKEDLRIPEGPADGNGLIQSKIPLDLVVAAHAGGFRGAIQIDEAGLGQGGPPEVKLLDGEDLAAEGHRAQVLRLHALEGPQGADDGQGGDHPADGVDLVLVEVFHQGRGEAEEPLGDEVGGGAELQGGEDVVLDEVLLQVEDVQLGSAGSLGLLFQTVQLSTLTHVAGDSDDFAVVVILFQPGNDDGGIQTARVSQNNFLNIFLFHDDRSFVYYTFYTFVCRPGIPPGALDVLSF